jgi:hypothetical protein
LTVTFSAGAEAGVDAAGADPAGAEADGLAVLVHAAAATTPAAMTAQSLAILAVRTLGPPPESGVLW